MGIFLQTSCEVRNAGSETKNKLIIKVIDYINRNLRNNEWQESIAGQLRKLEEQYSHKTLFIILRLFDIKDISEGKLKSFARYKKKDDKLVIDQMLVLNEYSDLPEDEMRIKMCDEIFEYVKE
ncbi:hypothetical protein Q4599_17560, partial [Cellulophaga lytica]|uniref:hypothetical protein n=1 Tax=Cellulophaga lytica TaxID=979 RepID=UPI0026E3C29E